MINVIKEHLKCYPKMEIRDVAKLLYQSEFGGGHLIKDEEMSLQRIQEEYNRLTNVEKDGARDVEDIGGGMCRMYLSCISKGMEPEVLNQIFVKSANHKTGTIEGLEEKLNIFFEGCVKGLFPYEPERVKAFYEGWKQDGYPAMSHSEVYRENYHPAYRVVEASYVQVYDVIRKVEAAERPFVVGIDGMAASGKSTMGALLQMNYPEANLFHVDDYFLQPHQRTAERFAEIGGNVDYERMKEEIISNLSNRDGLTYRVFDCQTQTLGQEIFAPWKELTFVEGCYSQHPYFGEVYDLCVFSEISSEEQVARIRKRNGEKMLRRFVEEWIPKENQYFETYKIKEKSGLQ